MADPSAATWQPGLWKVCNERLGLGISMSTCMYLKCIKIYSRRKFRSQTSDNMDRWKVGRVREEKSRREKIREEKE